MDRSKGQAAGCWWRGGRSSGVGGSEKSSRGRSSDMGGSEKSSRGRSSGVGGSEKSKGLTNLCSHWHSGGNRNHAPLAGTSAAKIASWAPTGDWETEGLAAPACPIGGGGST